MLDPDGGLGAQRSRPLEPDLEVCSQVEYDLERVLDCNDLVAGDDCFFSATGITDGDVLQGVRYQGATGATTESLVMRSRSGTVRRIHARHDRVKLRSY